MAEQIAPKLSRFERSPVTQALVDRILEAEPNEVIPYRELNALALGDVQTTEYHLLHSARHIALREGVATDAVTNEGIKRLGQGGAVDVASTRIHWINRASKKTVGILRTVSDPSSLDARRKEVFDATVVIGGVLNLFSSRRFGRKLVNAADGRESFPSPKEVIRGSLAVFNKPSDET